MSDPGEDFTDLVRAIRDRNYHERDALMVTLHDNRSNKELVKIIALAAAWYANDGDRLSSSDSWLRKLTAE